MKITRDFWLSQTEVTQAAWELAFPDAKPSYFKNCGPDCPVENITWWDAVLYCNELSKKAGLEECYDVAGLSCSGTPGDGYQCVGEPEFEGLDCKGYRLPTEAEWEYAARAGTTTAIYTGDIDIQSEYNVPNLGMIAWYGGNSGVVYEGGWDCSAWPDKEQQATSCGPHPIGQKWSNDYGLSDMLGNVFEWTGDWYGNTYYGTLDGEGLAVDPLGPAKGADHRVVRGGSWGFWWRAAMRYWVAPNHRTPDLGLRPARSIP